MPALMPARKTVPPPGYESLADATRRYGVSERTLRRRIEDGELAAERVPRPQGDVLFVKLPDDAAGNMEPNPAPDGSASYGQEQMIGSAIVSVMAPLLAELAESRRETAEVHEENASLREDRGRLQAEWEAASARAAELQAERDAARAELEALRSAPWWRRIFG